MRAMPTTDHRARSLRRPTLLQSLSFAALAALVAGCTGAAAISPARSATTDGNAAPQSQVGSSSLSAPQAQAGSPSPSAPPADVSLGTALPGAGSQAGSPAVVMPASSRFPGGLLIADRQNGRLIVVSSSGRILWTFPGRGSLPAGQRFSADDAFLAPDGKTIVANEEHYQVVVRIDIATKRVVWEYGHYGIASSRAGYLHGPDDAYGLPNGDVIVADISNCRVLEISPARKVVRHWGRAGSCTNQPPTSFAKPNGDTPLPDGGLLITTISGSRVVRLDASGHVVFNIHVPAAYPSDAQLTAGGNILVVDYARIGQVLLVSPGGHVLWRYRVSSGPGQLSYPSLAVPLPDGTIAVTDDLRERVVVIDPRTNRIVWQYGHTGRIGTAPGFLFTPDGLNVLPAGTIP